MLCEKPAARTYEEALEMQQAQHETGKILNIGVVNRFNTNVNRIKKATIDELEKVVDKKTALNIYNYFNKD